MRRIAIYLGTIALVLAAVGVVNWRMDPFGYYFRPGVLKVAAKRSCLVGDAIPSQAYLAYKEALFAARPATRTVVVGSSRTLKMASRTGESTFTNLGFPDSTPSSIHRLLETMHPHHALTIYLGVEYFWFNASWPREDFQQSIAERARYLLNWTDLRLSVDEIRQHGFSIRGDRWGEYHIGGHCILGRTKTPDVLALERTKTLDVWAADGSRLYSFELDPSLSLPAPAPFVSDVATIRSGIYARWRSLDRRELDALDRDLALAQKRHWRVIGFVPPDATRYAHLLETDPATSIRLREFFDRVPALFRKRGFKWLDLHDVRDVPCGQQAFIDDGYHPNAQCSARIRARLDAEANP